MKDKKPPILHVNIDHIATLREARKTTEPDPVFAALLAEQAGASGITAHLREDRRHIQDRDIHLIREMIQTRLNLEMAATDEMVSIALKTKPDIVTFVPEKREEVTTEGGLDCRSSEQALLKQIEKLKSAGIRISLFIDPDFSQIDAASRLAVDDIELHTGEYANASHPDKIKHELARLKESAIYGHQKGLQINAGHGLTYFNTKAIVGLPHLREINIGHSIIAKAAYAGISQAVKEMNMLITTAFFQR